MTPQETISGKGRLHRFLAEISRARLGFFASFLTFSAVILPSAAEPASSNLPNIILILADDLGWKDTGWQSDFYETPQLDRMAREGMLFHHAYAPAANCAPSRACLLSGTYTPRHHVYAVGSTQRGPKRFQRLIPADNKTGLSPDCLTMSEALKFLGYTTGIFGKWHLDGKDGASPKEQGFDVVFDSQTGNPNQFRKRPKDPKGAFSITRAAEDFIKTSQAENRPFFAFVSHHAIHTALENRPDSLEKFKEKARGKQHSRPQYAACIYDLDAAVGELLAYLKAQGLAENTLVIFSSDNGATPQSSQEPLRGNKGGYYEGGIRVPFIAWWPGKIKAGTESNLPVTLVDLFPTFLAVAGKSAPLDRALDGESLLPLLKGENALSREAIFWHFPGYLDGPVTRGRLSDRQLGFRTRPVSVIRKGDWKLHLFHEEWQLDGGREKLATNGAVELYQITKDPGEKNDLSSKEITQRDELLDDLLAWMQSCHAPFPSEKNPRYEATAASEKLHQTPAKSR